MLSHAFDVGLLHEGSSFPYVCQQNTKSCPVMDPFQRHMKNLSQAYGPSVPRVSRNSPFMALVSKGMDIYWRECLFRKAKLSPETMIRVSRLFDPLKLRTVEVPERNLGFTETSVARISSDAVYRMTVDGEVCSAIFGPLRALLRAALPRNREMRLTTSTCRGFEELAAVRVENATSANIFSIINRLREADGGILAVVRDITILSLQYVKPSQLQQLIPKEGVRITMPLEKLAGTASIYKTDDQVISRADNRVLDRLQAGMSGVIHVSSELTSSDFIEAIRGAAGKAELGTRKLILSYKHIFVKETGRTPLPESKSRCEEIAACLKRFFNNQKVQIWIDEILTRVNKTWFSSWVEVGLSPYTSAEILILNDDLYDLNSMWLNIELNMAIMCRGAVFTREDRLWTLVSKHTAQTSWYRGGTHIQGAGLSSEDALRMLLCRWISGIIPQNARDPADVEMLDKLAESFMNSTDEASLAHYKSTDMEKAHSFGSYQYMEMYSIRHDTMNEYSCCQFLSRQTIFDGLFPRMPLVSEKMIQSIAAVLPIDMSRCFDSGSSYLYVVDVGQTVCGKRLVLQMKKSKTITGEVIVGKTIRHNDARMSYELQRALDMAYDVHAASSETAIDLATNLLLMNLSACRALSRVGENTFQDQHWARACSDIVAMNAIRDSTIGFEFTAVGGELGEIRGFDEFLPVEVSGTASFFQLPNNISSNVSNRSQMRLRVDDIVRSTVRHDNSIAERLKTHVDGELARELIDLETENTFLVLQNGRIRVGWKRNGDVHILLGNLPILQAMKVKKEECTILSQISITAYHGSVEDAIGFVYTREIEIAKDSGTRTMRWLSKEAEELNAETSKGLSYRNTTVNEFMRRFEVARQALERDEIRDTTPKMLAMVSYAECAVSHSSFSKKQVHCCFHCGIV